MNTALKKKAVLTQKYKKGVYQHNRFPAVMWAINGEVTQEILEQGVNDDGTEFMSIRFNNIKKSPIEDEKDPELIGAMEHYLTYLKNNNK